MKTLLLLLISFVAVTSILSGILIIVSPGGEIMKIPLSMLNNSPFKNFLIPGIILMLVVGGTNLVAVLYNLQRHVNRYNWAMAGGTMLSGWIAVQMILIQSLSWLQFLYLGIGVLTILLAYQLKGKWAV